MAEEPNAELSAEDAFNEKVTNFIHGPEEEPKEETEEEAPEEEVQEEAEEEYEPDPKPEVEGDDESPEDIVEVEFEGQVVEAPRAIADALMRQEDHTQKTQALSADRKLLETEQANVAQLQKQYEFAQSVNEELIQAQVLDSQIAQAHEYLSAQAANMSAPDFQQAQVGIQNLKDARQKLVDSITSKQSEFQQAQEQSRKELLDKSTVALRSKIPNWDKVESEVVEYVTGLGFTEQQVEFAKLDPRQMELAHKARLYDQLQAGKTKAVTKAKAAPTIKAKPRKPMPKATGDKLNLRKKLKSPVGS